MSADSPPVRYELVAEIVLSSLRDPEYTISSSQESGGKLITARRGDFTWEYFMIDRPDGVTVISGPAKSLIRIPTGDILTKNKKGEAITRLIEQADEMRLAYEHRDRGKLLTAYLDRHNYRWECLEQDQLYMVEFVRDSIKDHLRQLGYRVNLKFAEADSTFHVISSGRDGIHFDPSATPRIFYPKPIQPGDEAVIVELVNEMKELTIPKLRLLMTKPSLVLEDEPQGMTTTLDLV